MNQNEAEELRRLAWEAAKPGPVTGAPPSGRTKMWEIQEAPGHQMEQTPGLWVLWGTCEDLDEECPVCGGTGDKVLATCGKDEKGFPTDQDMVFKHLGLRNWTPVRIQ